MTNFFFEDKQHQRKVFPLSCISAASRPSPLGLATCLTARTSPTFQGKVIVHTFAMELIVMICTDTDFLITVRTCKLAVYVILAGSPESMCSISCWPWVKVNLLVLFCHTIMFILCWDGDGTQEFCCSYHRLQLLHVLWQLATTFYVLLPLPWRMSASMSNPF